MAKLKLHNVVKRFGDITVCNGVNLDVDDGQMVSLIGASGAGKSTLLRCINLLEHTEDGEIFLDGEDNAVPGLNPQAARKKDWDGLSELQSVSAYDRVRKRDVGTEARS